MKFIKVLLIFFIIINISNVGAKKLTNQNTINNVLETKTDLKCQQATILTQKPEWVSEPKVQVKDIYRKLFSGEDKRISQENYYEVSLQSLYVVSDLKNKMILEVGVTQAKAMTSGHFKQVKGKKPYLVRAVFSNFTGRFAVDWDMEKKILMITHGSLGANASSPVWALPLIVNLEFKPKDVYVALDSAR